MIFGFRSLRLSTVQNRMRLTDQLGAVCRSPPSSEAKAFQLVESTVGLGKAWPLQERGLGSIQFLLYSPI